MVMNPLHKNSSLKVSWFKGVETNGRTDKRYRLLTFPAHAVGEDIKYLSIIWFTDQKTN